MNDTSGTRTGGSGPPLWQVEGIDIVRRRRGVLLLVTLGLIALGVAVSAAFPGVLPPRWTVGAAVGVAAVLLGFAAAVALDATDPIVRGPRHVGAAGGELVAVLPTEPEGDGAAELAAAVREARVSGLLRLGVAAGGRNTVWTAAWADELSLALARDGLAVLYVDLASGWSAPPGLHEVVHDGVRLGTAVSFESDVDLARLGAGGNQAAALDSLGVLSDRLPQDLDVLVVAMPTAASQKVVSAANSLDHVLIVGERDRTARIDLLAAGEALRAVGQQPQVILLDDVIATASAAPATEPEVDAAPTDAAESDAAAPADDREPDAAAPADVPDDEVAGPAVESADAVAGPAVESDAPEVVPPEGAPDDAKPFATPQPVPDAPPEPWPDAPPEPWPDVPPEPDAGASAEAAPEQEPPSSQQPDEGSAQDEEDDGWSQTSDARDVEVLLHAHEAAAVAMVEQSTQSGEGADEPRGDTPAGDEQRPEWPDAHEPRSDELADERAGADDVSEALDAPGGEDPAEAVPADAPLTETPAAEAGDAPPWPAAEPSDDVDSTDELPRIVPSSDQSAGHETDSAAAGDPFPWAAAPVDEPASSAQEKEEALREMAALSVLDREIDVREGGQSGSGRLLFEPGGEAEPNGGDDAVGDDRSHGDDHPRRGDRPHDDGPHGDHPHDDHPHGHDRAARDDGGL